MLDEAEAETVGGPGTMGAAFWRGTYGAKAEPEGEGPERTDLDGLVSMEGG